MTRKNLSDDCQRVYEQAQDISQKTEQAFSTAHLLLALFVVPNRAESLLFEHGINEELLLASLVNGETEAAHLCVTVQGRAAAFSDSTGSAAVSCLHLLAALTELPESVAYRLLNRCGLAPALVRARCLSLVTPTSEDEKIQSESQQRTTASYIALPEDNDVMFVAPEVPEETVETPVVARSSRAMRHSGSHELRMIPKSEDEERRSRSPGRRASDRPSLDGRRLDRRGALAPDATEASAPTILKDSPFSLDPEKFEWLCKLGTNMSEVAWNGGYDPVIGRDQEIEEAIDILNKRRSNNPCLVGEPGVGKTAIVTGVVSHLVNAVRSGHTEEKRIFVQVDVGSILAGTHLRGSLSERLRGLQDEVREARGHIIVFVDEVHTLIGAGGGDGGNDAANELKAALARGEFPCVGATTVDEYRKYVESDAALERRFTPVHIEEPDEDSTIEIIRRVVDRYAQHHGITYTDDAIETAVRLGRRYLHDRQDPDRSLSILDLAGAVGRRHKKIADRRSVAEVISRQARVPLDHVLVEDPERYLHMEDWLSQRIIGQSHILKAAAENIRRNLAGFSGRQPIGSFLFLGPTGVGKTETVKALAEFLFGTPDAMVRFDMSEFLESHSVSRLIGSPPGYVGYSDGGQLTDQIRKRPYQIVLFDEIEKSHRDVWNLLLQVLDDGQLTDGKGRTVDFSNTVIIMTSNLGAQALNAVDRRIGFAANGELDSQSFTQQSLHEARETFPPELWNRIGARLVFHPLDRTDVASIARLLLDRSAQRLQKEKRIQFTTTDAVVELLIEHGGFDPKLGARPMRHAIAREFETPLAEQILSGAIRTGDRVHIDVVDGELTFNSMASVDHEIMRSSYGPPEELERS